MHKGARILPIEKKHDWNPNELGFRIFPFSSLQGREKFVIFCLQPSLVFAIRHVDLGNYRICTLIIPASYSLLVLEKKVTFHKQIALHNLMKQTGSLQHIMQLFFSSFSLPKNLCCRKIIFSFQHWPHQ